MRLDISVFRRVPAAALAVSVVLFACSLTYAAAGTPPRTEGATLECPAVQLVFEEKSKVMHKLYESRRRLVPAVSCLCVPENGVAMEILPARIQLGTRCMYDTDKPVRFREIDPRKLGRELAMQAGSLDFVLKATVGLFAYHFPGEYRHVLYFRPCPCDRVVSQEACVASSAPFTYEPRAEGDRIALTSIWQEGWGGVMERFGKVVCRNVKRRPLAGRKLAIAELKGGLPRSADEVVGLLRAMDAEIVAYDPWDSQVTQDPRFLVLWRNPAAVVDHVAIMVADKDVPAELKRIGVEAMQCLPLERYLALVRQVSAAVEEGQAPPALVITASAPPAFWDPGIVANRDRPEVRRLLGDMKRVHAKTVPELGVLLNAILNGAFDDTVSRREPRGWQFPPLRCAARSQRRTTP
ncbi:MAG: hypothetical protein Kow0062_09020 [Acidobacteriota bacterium]